MPHSRVDGFCRDLRSRVGASTFRATAIAIARRSAMLIAVFVLTVLSQSVIGTAQADELSLQRLTSRYYTIYTNLAADEALALGQHMDIVFAEYQRRFTTAGFTSRDESPMPLYLFKRRNEYHSFLASHNVNSANTDGMFFVRA